MRYAKTGVWFTAFLTCGILIAFVLLFALAAAINIHWAWFASFVFVAIPIGCLQWVIEHDPNRY